MNTIYRIVLNVATGKWVVASELTKGRKKASKSSRLTAAAITATLAIASTGAFARTDNLPQCLAGEQPEINNCVQATDGETTPFFAVGGGNDNGIATNVAIGQGAANTSGSSSVAIGDTATTAANNSVAIGHNARTADLSNVAIGYEANTNGSNAISMGYNASANANYTTSIGGGSKATKDRATAIGTDSSADGVRAFAGGTNATATGDSSTALGTQAVASGIAATAVGAGASAGAGNSVALGANSSATRANTVSVGSAGAERQITNVLAGNQDTDAVNLGQMNTALATKVDTAFVKVNSLLTATPAAATGFGAVAIGDGASSSGNGDVALGQTAVANGGGSGAVSVGSKSIAGAAGTVAIGGVASANANNSVAVGLHSSATVANAVALGANSVANRANTVSVGSAGSGRQVVNVAAGTQTTDAVNLGQLQGTAQSAADALGGGAAVNADATIKAPSYTVADLTNGGSKTVNNVGAALDQLNVNTVNLDGRVTKNEGDITNLLQGKAGLVQQAAPNATVAVAAATGGTAVDFAGIAGDRQLKGVAAGTANNDAVNVQQLRTELANASASDMAYFQADGMSNKTDVAQVAAGSYGVAIGSNARANGENSVALGANSVADRDNVVSVGSGPFGNGTRQIINVANGNENADAVNVQQLKPVIAGLGGGAKIDANTGVVSGPTYNVQGGTQKDVGTALDALDTSLKTAQGDIINLDQRVTTNQGDITKLLQGKAGLVQQAAPNATVTVAAATGGMAVDFAGAAGDRQLKGVAAGTADNDAVNVAQLKSAGLIGDNGDVANLVAYDSGAKDQVTLGGTSATTPVALKNVAAGALNATSTDAVNGSQLYATNQKVDKNTGDITTINNQLGDIAANNKFIKINGTIAASATGGSTTAIGNNARANTTYATAVGTNASATGSSAAAFGSSATASGLGATAVGRLANASSDFATAVGSKAQASADASLALGNSSTASGIASIAIGSNAEASGDRAIALGGSANASGDFSMAVGRYSVASHTNSVALGQASTTDRDNSVSVGSAGKERQITNVADGTEDTDAVNLRQLKQAGLVGNDGSTLDAVVYDAGSNRAQITFSGAGGTLLTNVAPGAINATSMDAINGSQLWNVQDQVNKLGDRVTVVENNLAQPPVTPVDPANPGNGNGNGDANAHFASSGDQAQAAIAKGISSVAAGENAQANGDNATAIGAGSVASANNSVALGSGSVADRANSVSVGSIGNERIVANVADAVEGTDAVNKRSMDTAVAGAKGYTDQQIGMVQQAIGDVSRKAYAGIAGATALTMIPDVDQGKTVAVGVGVGTYQGYTASAIGVSARLSDRIKVKMGASVSTAGSTYGAGASYQW